MYGKAGLDACVAGYQPKPIVTHWLVTVLKEALAFTRSPGFGNLLAKHTCCWVCIQEGETVMLVNFCLTLQVRSV
jgi:hypothetical protein